MHEPDWLFKGTFFWKRKDNIFKVVSGSSFFLGMLTPRREVEKFGFDKNVMKQLVELLCDNLRFDKELLWNVSARYEGKYDNQRETNFLVESMEKMDLTYKTVLRDVPKKYDNIEIIMRSLRESNSFCLCGRGTEKDLICSMPYEACKSWDITKKEWEESLDIPKMYGEQVCKHIVRSYKVHGVYPVYNEQSFHLLLPEMIRDLNILSRKKPDFKEKDMDVIIRPYMSKLGFGFAFRYFKIIHEKGKIEKRMEKDFSLYPYI